METTECPVNNQISAKDKAYIKMDKSLVRTEPIIIDRLYECEVVEVINNYTFKLTMPVEYGEEVLLPLDRTYQIIFETEEERFVGYGMIISRFEDENGKCFIIQINSNLSKETSKKYLAINTNIQARLSLQDSKKTFNGIISRISLKNIVLLCNEYIEEKSRLDIVFVLEDKHEMLLAGEAKETLRNRQGLYETHIRVEQFDIASQHLLARWILDKV